MTQSICQLPGACAELREHVEHVDDICTYCGELQPGTRPGAYASICAICRLDESSIESCSEQLDYLDVDDARHAVEHAVSQSRCALCYALDVRALVR